MKCSYIFDIANVSFKQCCIAKNSNICQIIIFTVQVLSVYYRLISSQSGFKKVSSSLSNDWFWSVRISVYCGLNYCGVVRVPEKHFGYAQKEPHLKGSASSKKWSISEILFNVWIGGRVKPRPTGDSTINEWPRFLRPCLSLSLSLSRSLMQHICLLERGAKL